MMYPAFEGAPAAGVGGNAALGIIGWKFVVEVDSWRDGWPTDWPCGAELVAGNKVVGGAIMFDGGAMVGGSLFRFDNGDGDISAGYLEGCQCDFNWILKWCKSINTSHAADRIIR